VGVVESEDESEDEGEGEGRGITHLPILTHPQDSVEVNEFSFFL
jgi:hypothetical protein